MKEIWAIKTKMKNQLIQYNLLKERKSQYEKKLKFKFKKSRNF